MSLTNLFHDALNYGLEILGLSDIELKEKQYEALKAVVLKNRDVLAVLPTSYGKSLIYQLLPLVLDFFCGKRITIEEIHGYCFFSFECSYA